MKNTFPIDYFTKRLKKLDKRIAQLPNEDLLEIITDGFAEVSTIGMFFSDEEVIDMKPYYEVGEMQLTLDIEEDVTQIYDYYLTQENQAFDVNYHGIRKLQDSRFRRLDSSDVNSMSRWSSGSDASPIILAICSISLAIVSISIAFLRTCG